MFFRVTFSDDTNEYYKEVPRDTQVSLTIEAKSFKEAELKASQHLTVLLFWPSNFEIVSINRIDTTEVETVRTELFNSFAPTEKVIEPFEEVHDGWRSSGFQNGCRCEDCMYGTEEVSVETTGTWNQSSGMFTPEEYQAAGMNSKTVEPKKVSKEPVKKVPELWILQTGIQILDPDGWDRKDTESWYTPITRDEFIRRAMMSTCYEWPKPLYDEPGGEI